jgi:CubicO group peptidase (beta-lactamase class C family)
VTVPISISLDRLVPAASGRLVETFRSAVPEVAPAAALVVRQGGEAVFEVAAGSTSVSREDTPVGGETRFDLASLTKLFTATAFLGLASEGRVRLDDPVSVVIPEVAEGGPRRMDGGQEPLTRRLLPTPPDRLGRRADPATMTFRRLLTHSSGLAPWRAIFRVTGPIPPPEGPGAEDRARRMVAGLRTVCRSPFVAEPGAEVRYSDLGFMLLGEAVARLAGGPLDVAVHEGVCVPLGLGTVTYLPRRAGLDLERVAPTSVDDDWRMRRLWGEVEDENAAGLGGVAGHAGLFGTAWDVARFGQAWLDGDDRLGIDPDLAAEAVCEQTPGLGEARGHGWQVQPTDHLAPFGPRAYGHTGFTGTSLAIDPDRQLVVALLTNRVHAGRTHPGIDGLRLAVHEVVARP